MPNYMMAALSRIAASVVAVVVAYLADSIGVEVTAEAQASLTEGLTLLGGGLLFVVYAVVRPLISRVIHPADSSTPADAV